MSAARILVLAAFVAGIALLGKPLATQPDEIAVEYVAYVGRIELGGGSEPTLATSDGAVLLLPNRYGVLVAELGGCEVEVEGLLLGRGRPVLWIETIRRVGPDRRAPESVEAPREIPI